MKKSITRDELYLIKVLELAIKLGDYFEEVDRYAVGQSMGQNNKSVDNIVRMLAQTNFVKKGDGDNIFLTPQGLKYVETLKETS
ncbi:MAG: hypothetical protein FJZ57_00065 [Chlamydiae bacterium]|nr:hypothetical protein [Chlamydiota bacterium]